MNPKEELKKRKWYNYSVQDLNPEFFNKKFAFLCNSKLTIRKPIKKVDGNKEYYSHENKDAIVIDLDKDPDFVFWVKSDIGWNGNTREYYLNALKYIVNVPKEKEFNRLYWITYLVRPTGLVVYPSDRFEKSTSGFFTYDYVNANSKFFEELVKACKIISHDFVLETNRYFQLIQDLYSDINFIYVDPERPIKKYDVPMICDLQSIPRTPMQSKEFMDQERNKYISENGSFRKSYSPDYLEDFSKELPTTDRSKSC